MTYQETTDYLFNSYPVFENVGGSAYKEGLANTIALDTYFNHPHRHYQSIHIAGTNGKGSSSHTLAAILQEAGYKVGLYTSPHLVDFRERIRVDGECISKERVVRFVEDHKAFFESIHPSFFELTTALAFLYFKEQNADIAIVEVGLGGRLDCTNIISPILSVITNISPDHTQFLGNTLDKIAGEKAGIIKPHTPVVIGEALPETRPVFDRVASTRQAELVYAESDPEVTHAQPEGDGTILYQTKRFGTLRSTLSGQYQLKNTNTVLAALNILRRSNSKGTPLLHISDQNIKDGFAHVTQLTGLRGRWQVLGQRPLTICDTGHNVGAWQWLSTQIRSRACQTLRIVFGMVDDKDIDGVMALLPRNAVYYWTQATSKRAVAVQRLMQIGRNHYLHGTAYNTVAAAYRRAMSDAATDDFIFIGGSNYVVADLLSLNDF